METYFTILLPGVFLLLLHIPSHPTLTPCSDLLMLTFYPSLHSLSGVLAGIPKINLGLPTYISVSPPELQAWPSQHSLSTAQPKFFTC